MTLFGFRCGKRPRKCDQMKIFAINAGRCWILCRKRYSVTLKILKYVKKKTWPLKRYSCLCAAVIHIGRSQTHPMHTMPRVKYFKCNKWRCEQWGIGMEKDILCSLKTTHWGYVKYVHVFSTFIHHIVRYIPDRCLRLYSIYICACLNAIEPTSQAVICLRVCVDVDVFSVVVVVLLLNSFVRRSFNSFSGHMKIGRSTYRHTAPL